MAIVSSGNGEYELWRVNEVGEPVELLATGKREWIVKLARMLERRGEKVDVMKDGRWISW